MDVFRHPKNPIITAKDIRPSRPDFEVIYAMNCGVTRDNNGDVLLLLRVAEIAKSDDPGVVKVPFWCEVERKMVVKDFDKGDSSIDFSDSRFVRTPKRTYLSSISHLHVARSVDGINFEIEDAPAMFPCNEYEQYGIEDPRITKIDGTYWFNYSACSAITGVTTCLASTKDWKNYTRHGVIFTPDNKDICIFPKKINGKYYALNRPHSAEYGTRDMWISESPDLISWGNHRLCMTAREDQWDNCRVGCSAVPYLTDEGWLEIYHGASIEDRYCLGAVLLDKDEPWKIKARLNQELIKPETEYELEGFYGDVIFNCGALFENGTVKIYYGAADTCVGYAEIELSDIIAAMK